MSETMTLDAENVDVDAPKAAKRPSRAKATRDAQPKDAPAPAKPRRADPVEVDPSKPAVNSRQGKAMRATREHVTRKTYEGIEMETKEHYLTVIPNNPKTIALYVNRRKYETFPDHELNSDAEVVVGIRKDRKDALYRDGCRTIASFLNDGVMEEEQAGVEITNSTMKAEPLSKVVGRMRDEDADGAAEDGEEYEDG